MTTIYVATHKPVDIERYHLDYCYKLIRMGDYAREQVDVLADNTGDNISKKNQNYCELTAHYWIWKNDKTSDIVGLCHYRRYFTKAKFRNDEKYFLTEKDIKTILKTYDVIVSKKQYSYRGAYRGYLDCGRRKDLETVRDVIEKYYPTYLPFYREQFELAAGNYGYNMMISSKKIFDSYSEWLFDILRKVENRTDLSGYSKEEARIFGYISERLLGVWLAKNNKRVKEQRVINTESKPRLNERVVSSFPVTFVKRMVVYLTLRKWKAC